MEILRCEYRTLGAKAVAHRLGVPVQTVYRAASRFGVARPIERVVGKELDAHIRDHHSQGWSDSEITNAWNATHPKTICRRHLSERRRHLGLKSNANNERHRQRVAAKTQEQLKEAGCNSLAEVRAKAYRKFARDRGWPEDLRPREVQIMDLLYERGPHTRRGIAEGIGWNTQRDQRTWLCCGKYGRGSYLANLMARGLVIRLSGRVVKGESSGKSCYLYAIPIYILRGDCHVATKEQ